MKLASILLYALSQCRLRGCDMTDEGCSALTSALQIKPITPERIGPEQKSTWG